MFTFKVDEELSLKLLESTDAEELFTVLDANRKYLREWLPWVDGTQAVQDYYPVIEAWRKQFAEEDGFQVGILYKEQLVGMIGFHSIDRRNKATSIGYWLAEGQQGNGIMTRACQALVTYAFETLKLKRIEIRCGTGNKKSRAIPERLGFQHEGTIRCGEWIYDHFIDVEIYGLINE
ncbi:ribosomal-protein-serine acetyltransferase [Pullulanibacillus camelliae]|uniref:Ribosomal-protein-serine acetyltransferase n=1 Tax=Pullulanibacillus camelliae TaxID=1707096 RepID=A0A8J2VMH6_9BACL|nr:GNAT family protein [Pullulanibacillus camelliae]GGE28830.1 ribosomal-protein-serine acetyltransferase [Pullulanibacillus camelliae]